MSRAGRKRKFGHRKPSGGIKLKPKAEVAVNFRLLAAEQPHRRWLPEAARLDQRADSTIGCLYLKKRISESQYLAGEVYARRVGAYMATLDGPRLLAGAGRGYDCAPLGCRTEPESCECARRRRDYNELYDVLSKSGRKSLLVVNRVVVHNGMCVNGEMGLLQTGLSALARWLS